MKNEPTDLEKFQDFYMPLSKIKYFLQPMQEQNYIYWHKYFHKVKDCIDSCTTINHCDAILPMIIRMKGSCKEYPLAYLDLMNLLNLKIKIIAQTNLISYCNISIKRFEKINLERILKTLPKVYKTKTFDEKFNHSIRE